MSPDHEMKAPCVFANEALAPYHIHQKYPLIGYQLILQFLKITILLLQLLNDFVVLALGLFCIVVEVLAVGI